MIRIRILRHLYFVAGCYLLAPTIAQSNVCPEVDGCALKKYETASKEFTPRSYLVCRGCLDLEHNPEVHAVYICNYTNTTFNLNNVVDTFPNIRHVEIEDSNFLYLIGPSQQNRITNMKIRNTTLLRVAANLLAIMTHLRTLDLRNNSLEQLPINFTKHSHLHEIYLSGNMWNCTLEMIMWASNMNTSLIQDKDFVNCYGGVFNGKPLFHIAKFQKAAFMQCPNKCNCTLLNVVRNINDGNLLNPIIAANCSNQNLLELPTSLPNLTKILHVEFNHISDLSPVINNPAYQDLQKLYLDFNQVKSIAVLEGGQWLEKLSVLSLRSNKLVQLPWYALDNALKRNANMPNAVLFYLAGNPWRCDCGYTPHFQDMLMKYEEQIPDISDIRCRNISGDENSNLPILSLDRSGICRDTNEFPIKPLDLVNIILALLIALVIGKLAYDYYFFKKTGRLPWIVTKMP